MKLRSGAIIHIKSCYIQCTFKESEKGSDEEEFITTGGGWHQ